MYEDPETGYKIREINFDNRNETELYIEASAAVYKEIEKGGGKFRIPLLLTASLIGRAMRLNHLKHPRINFYLILDAENNPIAVGECFPAIKEYSPFEEEIYPIFDLWQFRTPFTQELAEAYKAFARMLKQQGHGQIYCHGPVNHNLQRWLPVKRNIGNFPRPPEAPMWNLLELSI